MTRKRSLLFFFMCACKRTNIFEINFTFFYHPLYRNQLEFWTNLTMSQTLFKDLWFWLLLLDVLIFVLFFALEWHWWAHEVSQKDKRFKFRYFFCSNQQQQKNYFLFKITGCVMIDRLIRSKPIFTTTPTQWTYL